MFEFSKKFYHIEPSQKIFAKEEEKIICKKYLNKLVIFQKESKTRDFIRVKFRKLFLEFEMPSSEELKS